MFMIDLDHTHHVNTVMHCKNDGHNLYEVSSPCNEAQELHGFNSITFCDNVLPEMLTTKLISVHILRYFLM